MALRMLHNPNRPPTHPASPTIQYRTTIRPTHAPRLVRAMSATQAHTQPTTLSDTHAQEWATCREFLVGKGWSAEDADALLCKAFGWSGQVYWRGSKEEQPPSEAEVQGTVEYLESIGILGDNLCKLVDAFPEVLGCGVDTIVRPNVEVLQKQWKIKGNTLVKTLLRRPDVLGYNLDCEGSCVGECERCWARF